jgi:fatty acid-binding protein DegV
MCFPVPAVPVQFLSSSCPVPGQFLSLLSELSRKTIFNFIFIFIANSLSKERNWTGTGQELDRNWTGTAGTGKHMTRSPTQFTCIPLGKAVFARKFHLSANAILLSILREMDCSRQHAGRSSAQRNVPVFL